MNTQRFVSMAMSALCVALVLAMTGCASSGYRRGQQVGAKLQSSADRIENRLTRLNLAVASLNELVNNPQADLRPQFKAFSSALGKPGALAGSIREADQDMESRGAGYFADWDKALGTIQNEAIRSSGQNRKQEVLSQYDAVRNSCLRVQMDINPLESDLQDVHRFLESDLTAGGLVAIRDATTRVNQLASPVNDSVTRLVSDMRALGMAMSPQNVVPQGDSK